MDHPNSARDRVDRFLVAFNTIEGELRRRLQAEKHVGYKELARRFRDQNGWWRPSYDAMETIADMRNFLVHEKVHPTIYAAVPSDDVIALIERIRDQLLRPTTVMERFANKVIEFNPDTELAAVLRVIEEKSITHFPIRRPDGTCQLLSTNGIAHWLARTGLEVGLVDLKAPVTEVLAAQEPEDDLRFVARSTPLEEAFELFAKHPQLRAVLITHNGRPTETPLGIVTAWDVAASAN